MTVESADPKKRMAKNQRGTERAARFVVDVERPVSQRSTKASQSLGATRVVGFIGRERFVGGPQALKGACWKFLFSAEIDKHDI